MKVITAVEQYEPKNGDISVFLGGGITNCRDWQKEIIERLSANENLKNLVVFNPRRENFPIHDPNASKEQIEWEFKYLMKSDIFSMFFCQDTESDQPICMYELGRYIPIKISQDKQMVITSEPGYNRISDVEIQCKLALNDNTFEINKSINQHIDNIINIYNQLNSKNIKPLIDNTKPSRKDSEKFINTGNGLITESKSLLNLNMVNFKNTKNIGLIFENKTFSNCMFNNSCLYAIKYKNCNLNKCNFNHSNFKDVVFENCEFGYSSFIGLKSNKNPFINCKFICCEQQSANKLNFDYIKNIISKDKRFSLVENNVYSVNIPEYSMLNILIMKNNEMGDDNCDVCGYITPKDELIKQLTPLFITYDFDQIADLFKFGDFCNNFISDIIKSINLKYKPIIKNCVEQLNKITKD